MAALSKEIAAYKRMRDVVEADHFGEWVLVHDERLVGSFNSFEAAAEVAIERFGRGPYLTGKLAHLLSLCRLHGCCPS